ELTCALPICRTHLPRPRPRHRPRRGRPPRARAPREALLPAQPPRQGRAHTRTRHAPDREGLGRPGATRVRVEQEQVGAPRFNSRRATGRETLLAARRSSSILPYISPYVRFRPYGRGVFHTACVMFSLPSSTKLQFSRTSRHRAGGCVPCRRLFQGQNFSAAAPLHTPAH